MPSCLTGLASYASGCRDASGVADVWVREWSAATTYTYTSTGIITGSTIPTIGTWYNLAQRQETAEFQPGVGSYSNENGTVFYTGRLSLTMHKYQATLRNLIVALGKGECEFIVQTVAGLYFIVGEELGALAVDSNTSMGKGFGDLNGTNITFEGKGTSPSREVNSTWWSTQTIA